MNRRDFIATSVAVGISARGVSPKPEELDEPINMTPPEGRTSKRDILEAIEKNRIRIRKKEDRARFALKFIGEFTDEEVEVIRGRICKREEHKDMDSSRSFYLKPRAIFIHGYLVHDDDGKWVATASMTERIRIWDAICVSFKTCSYDGFDLLGIDTWWEKC